MGLKVDGIDVEFLHSFDDIDEVGNTFFFPLWNIQIKIRENSKEANNLRIQRAIIIKILRERGVTLKKIGELLNVTHQRVSEMERY